MVKVAIFVVFALLLVGMTGIVCAEQIQAGDTTGPMHEEVVAAGGQQLTDAADARVREGFQIFPGEYRTQEGTEFRVNWEGIEGGSERIRLRVRNISAHSDLVVVPTVTQGRARLNVMLSNGRNAEVKVMPDVAAETALQRLRLRVCTAERNCTLELKEVGEGNETRLGYEMKAERNSRVLGLFRKRMQVESQVDAETGELISVKKPWWAFLASEAEE